jgi:hypothetical protein
MELNGPKRQHEGQAYSKELLIKLHAEEQSPHLTNQDAKFLYKFYVKVNS